MTNKNNNSNLGELYLKLKNMLIRNLDGSHRGPMAFDVFYLDFKTFMALALLVDRDLHQVTHDSALLSLEHSRPLIVVHILRIGYACMA